MEVTSSKIRRGTFITHSPNHYSPSTSTQEHDSFLWDIEETSNKVYSSSKTWEVLIPRQEEKEWTKLVWFKGAVPKYAFNMWLVHKNRLPTWERLASWGLNVSSDCCLCSRSVESRDHLFLTCNFATDIWNLVLSRLDTHQRLFYMWSELLSWLKQPSSLAFSILRKVAIQATFFHIWKQRNNVLHNLQSLSAQSIFNSIDREVKDTITSRSNRRGYTHLRSWWMHWFHHNSISENYRFFVFVFFCQDFKFI